jgi:hypothetical protein
VRRAESDCDVPEGKCARLRGIGHVGAYPLWGKNYQSSHARFTLQGARKRRNPLSQNLHCYLIFDL